MGGGIFTPAQKARKSKTNQTQQYHENNNVEILQPDFLNDIIKECVEHALIDDSQIRIMIKQKYEFYLQCIRLPKMDYISKTDPSIYCYLVKDNEPEFIHKTEVIADEQDPLFAKPLVISFDLTEFNRDIIFNIYDIDKYNQFGEHERQYIGTVQTSISSILMEDSFQCAIRYDDKQSGESKKEIQSQKKNSKSNQSQQRGEFRIRQYNCDSYSDIYIFQIEGINIKSKESIYLKVVTFNKFWNQVNDNEKPNNAVKDELKADEPKELPLYQTDLVKNQKVIPWNRFEIQEKRIIKYLKFEVYQFYESRVKKDLIGEFKIMKEEINTLHATEQPIRILNKKSINGVLRFQKVTRLMHPHTLLHYIYGGLNVQFMMAFDYSQIHSNIYSTEQEVANSKINFLIIQNLDQLRNCMFIHQDSPKKIQIYQQFCIFGIKQQLIKLSNYNSQILVNNIIILQNKDQQYIMNQYESAISNCIDLIRYYQSNQMVPMYGMGARLPPSYTHHSNCFSLSGDWYDPEIDIRDKDNAINVFKSTFKRIKPSSSLVFSDMLEFANKYCKEEEFNNQNQSLCVLLIFSHNELLESDIVETIKKLSFYVEVPFQVINIGIGNQQFQYIQTLQSEENYEVSKKFSFIPYENFKSDQIAFCSEIFKNIPKSLLERARNQRIPPLKSFENMLNARDYYQNNLTIGQKKTFGCINERPFFDQLTVELGYKVDLIKDIFINGLEEEDLGLVLDRIGTYSKSSHSHANSRYYQNSKHSDQSVPEMMLSKVKEYYRLKEKFNAHTKKQESKTLAIKKQNADNLSPFSFFYKSDQKHDKQDILNPQILNINRNRLAPNYPESYLDTKINSANNLLISDQELYPSKANNSVYNGWKSDDIENNFSFSSSPLKLQNSGFLQDSLFKKPLKQNNFLNKWRDAVNQSAKLNNSPMIASKKQKHVIQGIQCTFCTGDEIQIILMPCGHNCCCQEYLDQFDDQVCPICRIHITQIIKFYDEEENNDDNVSEIQSKRSKSREKFSPSPQKKEIEKNEPQIQLHVEKQEIISSMPNKKKDKYYSRKSELDGNIILKY